MARADSYELISRKITGTLEGTKRLQTKPQSEPFLHTPCFFIIVDANFLYLTVLFFALSPSQAEQLYFQFFITTGSGDQLSK